MSTAVAAAAIVVLIVFLVIWIVNSLIIVCPPNRVAVISGRSRTLSDGRRVGYRILKGGRTLRIPIIERVAWIDLNTIPLVVEVTNAYSAGAIPLNVQGIANVKVSSKEGLLDNAAERFLNVPHDHIGQIAKETLEANLRGVLATLSPEEVNEDRLKFSQQLIDEADDDIKTLGLELDVMKIQNVTDDNQYLESVGRRLTAEVVKEARVAEANRMAESEQAEAQARERAQIAQVQADDAFGLGMDERVGQFLRIRIPPAVDCEWPAGFRFDRHSELLCWRVIFVIAPDWRFGDVFGVVGENGLEFLRCHQESHVSAAWCGLERGAC